MEQNYHRFVDLFKRNTTVCVWCTHFKGRKSYA